MNILLYGGSFNPVHNGHVRLLENLVGCERLGVGKIIIMPAYVSPFKQNADYAPADMRLEMCRLAFGDFPHCEISGHEINSGGISYTVDTVRYLSEKYPADRLLLAVGGDSLKTFDTWHRFGDILRLCTLAAGARNAAERRELETAAENLRSYGSVEIIDSEPFEISSTEVRRMIRDGEDISGCVPDKIAGYIAEKGLYKIGDP